MAKSPASAPKKYAGPASLAGKVAVVTGGSQGLGEAIARLFADRGAAGLVICGRNKENGERVAAEIEASGCPTIFVRADLANESGLMTGSNIDYDQTVVGASDPPLEPVYA